MKPNTDIFNYGVKFLYAFAYFEIRIRKYSYEFSIRIIKNKRNNLSKGKAFILLNL